MPGPGSVGGLFGSVSDGAVAATDQERLVQGLRAGQEWALRSLYDHYSDRVFAFLFRLTGRRDIADDLHQDTWVAVARHGSRLRADSDPAAWLFTVARNQYRSWYRSTRRTDDTVLAAYQEDAEEDAQAGAALDSASVHDLEGALATLPPPLREVLLLMGCEGLDSTQTAAVLDISRAAVRQRLCRARAALLAALSADIAGDTRLRTRRLAALKG